MCQQSVFLLTKTPFRPSFEGQSCPADAVDWRVRAKKDLRAGLLNVVVKFKGEGGRKESRSAKANKNHWRASWRGGIWETLGGWKLANRV